MKKYEAGKQHGVTESAGLELTGRFSCLADTRSCFLAGRLHRESKTWRGVHSQLKHFSSGSTEKSSVTKATWAKYFVGIIFPFWTKAGEKTLCAHFMKMTLLAHLQALSCVSVKNGTMQHRHMCEGTNNLWIHIITTTFRHPQARRRYSLTLVYKSINHVPHFNVQIFSPQQNKTDFVSRQKWFFSLCWFLR